MIKKADVLLGVVLLLCGCMASAFLFISSQGGSMAEVSVDGKSYGTYDLGYNQVVKIAHGKGKNELKISDNQISMVYADCPDQYCVKHKPIGKSNETIVCLPNKVVVNIQWDQAEEGGVDATTN